MKNTAEIFGMSLMATTLFVVAHFVMRPAPVPAPTGLAGGLVALPILAVSILAIHEKTSPQ